MIETFDAALPGGITLSCRAGGWAGGLSGAPRVLLLHGFPEAAFVWDEVIGLLGDPVRCVAPNLRGFERSSSPPQVQAYRVKHLLDDIEALIRTQSGGVVDLLVAHDWGGALAWSLAAQRPQLMKRLLIINSPHPATFLRDLRNDAAQQKASAYMNFLCRPDAEALLAADGHRRMWALLHSNGTPAWLTPALRSQYQAVWQAGLTGALNYYRASPLKPPVAAGDAIHQLEFSDEFVTVRVPTTVLWGEADIALRATLLDGLQRWVPDLQVQRVPEASHWIVHEQPQRVVAAIVGCLARPVP